MLPKTSLMVSQGHSSETKRHREQNRGQKDSAIQQLPSRYTKLGTRKNRCKRLRSQPQGRGGGRRHPSMQLLRRGRGERADAGKSE